MAYVVADYYMGLKNSERRRFAMDFASRWLNKDIYLYKDVPKSKEGFSTLLSLLSEMVETTEKEVYSVRRFKVCIDSPGNLCII